jgi:hypothetical protein
MDQGTFNSLKILVRAHYDYQRERIRLDGMLGIKKTGEKKKKTPERNEDFLAELYRRRKAVYEIELATEKEIANEIHTLPLWIQFLRDVKGVGEMIAAVIITEIDINKAVTVSNIWSFAGLAPGKDRKTKGKKCPYNQFLRAKLCGILGSSFLKSNSPYRIHYDNTKHRLESMNWGTPSKNPTKPGKPKAGHQHKAAIRKMVKEFLKDLYVAWRTFEDLPVREPYAVEYLGKKHND